MRNDLGFEGLDPFTQVVAVIMQSGDRLLGLFGNDLVRINKRHEFVELSYAFWNSDPKFGCQATHGVGQHRLLFDQQGPSRMQGQDALLLHALGRHELHVGPGRGFTDRSGICGIVLLSLLYKGLHRFGRDQLHAVPEAGQHAGPVVGGATSFHDDRTSRLLLKERDQIVPSQLPSDLRSSGFVHAMNLEDGLGCIEADHANAHRGRLLCCRF
jgi:hypothetical protein